MINQPIYLDNMRRALFELFVNDTGAHDTDKFLLYKNILPQTMAKFKCTNGKMFTEMVFGK